MSGVWRRRTSDRSPHAVGVGLTGKAAMMLNSAVLVLNRNYQPVHVTSVKRAFSLLYLGVAKAIDEQYRLYEFADWAALSAASHDCITTINRPIRVPRVVVLSAYEYLPGAGCASPASTSTRATTTPASTAAGSCRARS